MENIGIVKGTEVTWNVLFTPTDINNNEGLGLYYYYSGGLLNEAILPPDYLEETNGGFILSKHLFVMNIIGGLAICMFNKSDEKIFININDLKVQDLATAQS